MPIPSTHPRIWIQEPGRLAYWQSCAAAAPGSLKRADWDNFLADNYGGYPWHYAMRYKVTGSTSYRDQCITALNAEKSAKIIKAGACATNQWQEARDYCLSWAICYDWLYDELPADLKDYIEDCLLACVFVVYHANDDAQALSIYSPGGTSPKTNAYDEGVNNPDQNFSATYHFIAMMAGAALGAAHKTTFRAEPGDPASTLINFSIQFNHKVPSEGGTYTDITQFVRDRLDIKFYPDLHGDDHSWRKNMPGGGWSEGSNYGVSIGKWQCMAQSIWRDYGWTDTDDEPGIYRDHERFHIYEAQPGNRVTNGYGEHTGSLPIAPVANYMRGSMLGAAFLYGDPYTQWWLNNVFPQMGGSETDRERRLDLLMGKRDQTATDYRPVLPTHYATNPNGATTGIGFWTSRRDWANDAACVSMRMGILIQNHTDQEIGQLLIYKNPTGDGLADGFSLCDPAHYWGAGTVQREVAYHNTMQLFESTTTVEGPSGFWWPQRFTNYDPMIRPRIVTSGDGEYAYCGGKAYDIYWQIKTPPGAHGGTLRRQINDVFDREVIHIKAGGHIIVFDRFRVLPTYARPDTNARHHWHWNTSQPTDVGGGVYRHDNPKGGRTFFRNLNGGAVSWETLTQFSGHTVQRMKIDHLLPTGYMWDVSVFEVPDSPAKASMEATELAALTAGGVDSTMYGASVLKAGARMHVLFSAEEDGATPATIVYHVNREGGTDRHFVANLTPGETYDVTETVVSGALTRYELAVAPTGFTADEAGVVVFTVNELTSGGTAIKYLSDGTVVLTDSIGAVMAVAHLYDDLTLVDSVSGALLTGGTHEDTLSDNLTLIDDLIAGVDARIAEATQIVVTDSITGVMATAYLSDTLVLTDALASVGVAVEGSAKRAIGRAAPNRVIGKAFG